MPRQKTLTIISGLIVLAPLLSATSAQDAAGANDNVVLVTFDGARTEEIFGGLQLDILKSTMKEKQAVEDSPAYRRFWAATAEERRQKLMPFFWSLVTRDGSIAGNRRLGSVVRLTNGHWFSYPGYSEILVGQAHDEEIKSNDPIRNPHSTVLEGLREHLRVPPDKVATFASWAVFNQIVEHQVGKTLVNAGVEPLESLDNPKGLSPQTLEIRQGEAPTINALQQEVVTPWDGTRFDAFSFRLSMTHLAAARPRVLYLAFDETDDWAHDGRYERVLDALARTDAFLEQLWTWLQNDAGYRGKTHLLITTDHGRGRTPKDWRDHGAKVDGSQEVWIAFASPRMSIRGEWRGHPALATNQIAATIGQWMGLDWNASHPTAGKPIAVPAAR